MAAVRFPDAEGMESVLSINRTDAARGSGRGSWAKLATRLSNGSIQVKPFSQNIERGVD